MVLVHRRLRLRLLLLLGVVFHRVLSHPKHGGAGKPPPELLRHLVSQWGRRTGR